jgi:Na+/H+ antiporter NhaB
MKKLMNLLDKIYIFVLWICILTGFLFSILVAKNMVDKILGVAVGFFGIFNLFLNKKYKNT